MNAAAKMVIGDHIWQAGSHKTEEKGRLDITHYEKLDDETLQDIEDKANEIVADDLAVEKEFVPRTDAENQYGFRIYQGGAVPGKTIRIVRIGESGTDTPVDVEACGGTHVTHTGEVGTIRMINTTKVQDGTIRLEYVAGEVAEEHAEIQDEIQDEIGDYVDTEIPLEDIADIFSVETEQLPRIVARFVDEWDERADEINELKDRIDVGDDEGKADALDTMVYDERPRDPQTLFDEWKQQEKDIDTLQEFVEEQVRNDLLTADDDIVRERIATEDVGMLIRTAKHVVTEQPTKAVVLIGENAVIGAAGDQQSLDMEDEVAQYAETVQGDADFSKGFQLKTARIKKV